MAGSILLASFGALLILVALVSAAAVDSRLYQKGFEKAGTYSLLGKEETESAAATLQAYLKGSAERWEDPRLTVEEQGHMEDVRRLLIRARTAVQAGIALLTAVALWMLCLRRSALYPLVSFLRRLAYMLLGIILLGILLGGVDFWFAFQAFHAFFFKTGSWQFPDDAFLLQLFPLTFFETLTWMIALRAGFIAVLILLCGWIIGQKGSRSWPNAVKSIQ